MRTSVVLLIASIALAACGDGEEADDSVPPDDGGAPPAESAAIPKGAIKVGEDLFMVPAGLDASGCALFTPWSATKAVIMVIHYRDRSGGFTPNRSQADCPP